MFFVQDDPELDLNLSRTDKEELLSSHSNHPFELDGHTWPTVEHYFQAMKYDDAKHLEKVLQAPTPEEATKLGKRWFKQPRKDWKKLQTVYMTRAVYTKIKTYSNIADYLLSTGDQKIVENSLYDFYWGCGRDRRGENHYGQILMNVRAKLKQEIEESSDEP